MAEAQARVVLDGLLLHQNRFPTCLVLMGHSPGIYHGMLRLYKVLNQKAGSKLSSVCRGGQKPLYYCSLQGRMPKSPASRLLTSCTYLSKTALPSKYKQTILIEKTRRDVCHEC